MSTLTICEFHTEIHHSRCCQALPTLHNARLLLRHCLVRKLRLVLQLDTVPRDQHGQDRDALCFEDPG